MLDNSSEIVKKPIKHLEIPINKFNEEAIPHHLNQIRKHRSNIIKFQKIRNWDGVYSEQISASRIVKQLTQLLYEMDSLRNQVIDKDVPTFDKLTLNSRNDTLNAIKEYSDLQLKLPLLNRKTIKEDDEQSNDNPFDNHHMQILAEREELERQKACLEAHEHLQNNIQELHELFVDFSKVVVEQGESVNRIENNIEDTQLNVHYAVKSLEKAAKYKTMTYPLAGALLGTCIGGPVGLMAGFKLGSIAALGGGFLGFTGGKIIKEKSHLVLGGNLKAIEAAPPTETSDTHSNLDSNNIQSNIVTSNTPVIQQTS